MDLAVTEEGDDYTVKESPKVPAWRVIAGNCGAGATAGAAVEAGAACPPCGHRSHICIPSTGSSVPRPHNNLPPD